MLEKPGVPTVVFTADLKLSITQAELLRLPINLITCGRSWPWGGRSPRSLCLLQASIFLTPGLANPSWMELPAPFLCIDGCFWMDGPPLASRLPCIPTAVAPITCPHPSWTQSEGRVPRVSPWRSGIECVWFQAQGNLTAGTLSHPLPPGSSGSGFPVCRRSPRPPKRGKLRFLGAYCVPNTSNASSDFIFTTAL